MAGIFDRTGINQSTPVPQRQQQGTSPGRGTIFGPRDTVSVTSEDISEGSVEDRGTILGPTDMVSVTPNDVIDGTVQDQGIIFGRSGDVSVVSPVEVGPQGPQGPQGFYDVTIYMNAASLPPSPPPTPGITTPPAGWSFTPSTPPTGQNVYIATGIYDPANPTNNIEWSHAFEASGDTGPQGPRGPAGMDGTNGRNGMDGTNGRDGRNGMDGARGPQGPQGVQGNTGERGEDGPQGDTLVFWFMRSATAPATPTVPAAPAMITDAPAGWTNGAAPTGSDPVYFVTSYFDPASSSFGAPSTPAEATGNTGPQGPAGPRGAQGERGERGERGLQGIQGPAGQNGMNGTNGTNGRDGMDGAPGRDGTNGTNGRDGRDGAVTDVVFIENGGQARQSLDGGTLTLARNVGVGGGGGTGISNVTIRPGSNITVNGGTDPVTGTDFTIASTGGGGGGTTSLSRKEAALVAIRDGRNQRILAPQVNGQWTTGTISINNPQDVTITYEYYPDGDPLAGRYHRVYYQGSYFDDIFESNEDALIVEWDQYMDPTRGFSGGFRERCFFGNVAGVLELTFDAGQLTEVNDPNDVYEFMAGEIPIIDPYSFDAGDLVGPGV